MKRNRLAIAVSQLLRSPIFRVLAAIFDDRELYAVADLRSSQSNAGSGAHGFPHRLDQLLHVLAADLRRLERTSRLPEHRFTGLQNGEWH